jgi:hypothetical protein
MATHAHLRNTAAVAAVSTVVPCRELVNPIICNIQREAPYGSITRNAQDVKFAEKLLPWHAPRTDGAWRLIAGSSSSNYVYGLYPAQYVLFAATRSFVVGGVCWWTQISQRCS